MMNTSWAVPVKGTSNILENTRQCDDSAITRTRGGVEEGEGGGGEGVWHRYRAEVAAGSGAEVDAHVM